MMCVRLSELTFFVVVIAAVVAVVVVVVVVFVVAADGTAAVATALIGANDFDYNLQKI